MVEQFGLILVGMFIGSAVGEISKNYCTEFIKGVGYMYEE